ncbi:APC family permease [Prauserella muralis]|uniref:Amino acid permease n=1 Tax=Prauserella muralis TaxID=588067 RepID=A0A2V4AKI5_9PSEU|nr:APC family permease [Prauserella muralis]PXY20787.1 amino acid permease [Prauserella muralis]TWE29810.1 amino acid/polyamine/organocation transporter (APC superfamily) [Prauserella muralis]
MAHPPGALPVPLRAESPMAGLDRRNLGPLQVFAQSVSGAAPSAAMAAAPAVAAVTAGQAVLWSFVVATCLALLIGLCIGQFTRRMAAAGSLYSLTAKGLGPVPAFMCGWALLTGYGLLAMAALVGAGSYLQDLLRRVGVPPGWPLLAGLVLLLGLLATVLVLRGVRLSAQVVLVVEAVAITLLLVVFGLLLARIGPWAGSAPFAPDEGIGGIAAGVLPAIGGFVGFEAAASFGVEARRPFQTVPRAVQWTAGLCGVLYLVAAYTQVIGLQGLPGKLAGQPEPVSTLAQLQRMPWLSVLLDVGIAASFFACTMATGGALVRVLLSMGREGIVPRRFGATHPRYRTPHVAILVALPVATLVPVVLLAAGVPWTRLFVVLLNVAVFGYLIAYLLVCVAAPVFLHRIGELTRGAVAASAVSVPVLLVAVVAFTVSGSGDGYPLMFALLAAAGLVWFAWVRLRRADRLPAIGIYDETSAADLFDGHR